MTKSEQIEQFLTENPEYFDLSGSKLAKMFIERGIFDKISPQYVNKVKNNM